MLETVPERGTRISVVRLADFALGLAEDDRRPDEGSICERDGWAAGVVGTVDNLQQLRGASPAEAVLELIRSNGPQELNQLRGVFAAVVTDGRRAWAARDQLGTETLYYHVAGDRLLLVSEPKQLTAVPGVHLQPDLEIVEAIFYGENYEPDRSVYRNVGRVQMASYVEWDATHLRVGRYWHPARLFETARLSPADIRDRFDELMSQAVRRTLRGDDAILLSGGIDSPAVAAYAGSRERQNGQRPVGAISGVYPKHPSVDETPLIQMLAKEFGLELHTYEPPPLSLKCLAHWVRTFDGPWSAWHPGLTEFSYQLAASLGYKVLLTGFFAENVADLHRGLVPYLVSRGRVRPAMKHLRYRRAIGTTREANARLVASTLLPRWVMARRRRRLPVAIIPSWMDRNRLAERDAAITVAPRNQWKTAQLGFLSGQHPSMEAFAKLQARWGIRARHPFSDVDLWEFFVSLPAQDKHPDGRGKALLRNVLRGRVPDVILTRRKVVFNAFITDRIDYDSLRHWLIDPEVRIRGIDYPLLAERLTAQNMSMSEFMSAKDLATAHAFLAQW
ncbi:MAG TPA: asparagine synthase-related protein [Longimicrobiales bacterium]|nr:asparagine synthase-related protein [Longimicrobiales bacterium]